MKILRLVVENVKKVKAVTIEPSGHLVVIGGKNDAGKSSCLDSIEMALAGAGHMPSQPVRRGAKSGRIRLELGQTVALGPELIVKLVLTASGGRALSVENREGFAAKAPQKLLDELYNALTFDPLEFERQDDKQQAETLRTLVGLDLRAIDTQRQALYDERTIVNRDVKGNQIDVDSLPRYPEAPAEEVSIAGLTQELAAAERQSKAAREKSRAAEQVQAQGERLRQGIKTSEDEIERLQLEIERLHQLVARGREALEGHAESYAVAEAEAADALAAVPDTAAIRQRIIEAEAINTKVRDNRRRQEAVDSLEKTKGQAQSLTNRITALDAERVAKIAAAKFPVPGLGLDEVGVTFEELPFHQASSSTRTMVSMLIAIAKNPKLRVALVRDGSLIGSEKLQMIAEIAESQDAQVWIEMLQESPNDRTSVYIEDGALALVPAGA